jgi:phosphohistidine swiveling domain-containing protein
LERHFSIIFKILPLPKVGEFGDTICVLMNLMLKGRSASPGVRTGQAWIAASPEAATAQPGCILVLKISGMDWIESISQAAAVVTEVGGATSHAATICRELGKPCVTAVANATSIIQTGSWVTVDGSAGTVTVLE